MKIKVYNTSIDYELVTRFCRFESLICWLQVGLYPCKKYYTEVYNGEMPIDDEPTIGAKLNKVYSLLNRGEKPFKFRGHSMSVSDVVVIDDEAWYVDGVGFKKLETKF